MVKMKIVPSRDFDESKVPASLQLEHMSAVQVRSESSYGPVVLLEFESPRMGVPSLVVPLPIPVAHHLSEDLHQAVEDYLNSVDLEETE